jgi:Uma2 family endonuclease
LVRLGFKPDTKVFFPGAPDLAIEILSPGNSRAEMEKKLSDYFSSGAEQAWLVDPENEEMEIWHSLTDRRLAGSEGMLTGEPILPGFRLPVSDLFKSWDWE